MKKLSNLLMLEPCCVSCCQTSRYSVETHQARKQRGGVGSLSWQLPGFRPTSNTNDTSSVLDGLPGEFRKRFRFTTIAFAAMQQQNTGVTDTMVSELSSS